MNKNEIEVLRKQALKHVWLQFTQKRDLPKKGPRIIVSGKGCIVKDHEGREYIDAIAGIQTTLVGHNQKEIIKAIQDQLNQIEFFPSFGDSNIPSIKLAKELSQVTPPKINTFFFVNSGSEATEAAMKIAKAYHGFSAYPRKRKIISRRRAFHGTTMGALSANGFVFQRSQFEPLLPGYLHISPPYCYRCDFKKSYPKCDLDCAYQLEQIIKFEDPQTVAAMIAEPVMGATAGIIIPPPEYFPIIRKICDKYKVLLILDEVITGFGRTGKFFACEHWGIQPDIICLAKGLSSGYLPIGAVGVSNQIVEKVYANSTRNFVHGHTYGGHPVCCAAALENVQIIQRENLVQRSQQIGEYLSERLNGSLQNKKIVGDIRGIGMLFCIELVKNKTDKEQFATNEVGLWVKNRCSELGVIVREDQNKICLAPPLVLEKEQADKIVEVLSQALSEAENKFI